MAQSGQYFLYHVLIPNEGADRKFGSAIIRQCKVDHFLTTKIGLVCALTS
jgi:hypothetical protein